MRTARLPLVVLASALAGCGTRGSLYSGTLTPLDPVITPSAVVSVVPQTRRAVIIRPRSNPDTPVGAPAAVQISPMARFAAAAPDGEVVILAGPVKGPVVDLLDPVAGTIQTLPIHGIFDNVAFAADAKIAILSYSATRKVAGLAARNLNEVDVLDLVGRTVTRMQLDTESLAPRSIVFAPYDATRERQLTAVTFDRGVAVFDALAPGRQTRRVPIRPPASTSNVVLLEALFSPDGRYLYCRATGLDDVIVIELGSDAQGELTAAINFIAGGTGLADIDIPRAAGQEGYVLAVFTGSGSTQAVMLDARGIEDNARRIPLGDALRNLRALPDGKVLIFDGTLRTVVAWDPRSGKSGSAVLDAGFDSSFVDEPLRKVVFRHPTVGSALGAALSVVSVTEDVNRLRAQIRSIQLASNAEALSLDGGGGRLFFATRGDNSAPGYVVRLDLGTLELGQVALDAAATSVAVLEDSDTVAAFHSGNAYGDLTLVPASTLDRPHCDRVADWALTADLDRPEEGE